MQQGVDGLLALLPDETVSDEAKALAVESLLRGSNDCWYIIAEGFEAIEALASDASFGGRRKAALLASKILYSLEQLDEAVEYAMKAGEAFRVSEQSDFSRTMVALSVQKYCQERGEKLAELVENLLEDEVEAGVRQFLYTKNGDSALERVVERMLEESVSCGKLYDAVGAAIECRRYDIVKEILQLNTTDATADADALLWYVIECSEECLANATVAAKLLLDLVLDVAEEKFPSLSVARPYALKLASAMYKGNRPEYVAKLLVELLINSAKNELGFELAEMPKIVENEEETVYPSYMVVESDAPTATAADEATAAADAPLKTEKTAKIEDTANSNNSAPDNDVEMEGAGETKPLLSAEGGVASSESAGKGKSVEEPNSTSDKEKKSSGEKTSSSVSVSPSSSSQVATISVERLSRDIDRNGADDRSLAFQIALNLATLDDQPFTRALVNEIRKLTPKQEVRVTVLAAKKNHVAPTVNAADKETPLPVAEETSALLSGDTSGVGATTESNVSPSIEADKETDRSAENERKLVTPAKLRFYFEVIETLLSGTQQRSFLVRYLHKQNRTDLKHLESLKDVSGDGRSSALLTGVVICHALMQAGTTNDVFVRHNLDFLARAAHWAKFTVAASSGVLHRGHANIARRVLNAYLPGAGGGPYSEGGALYAMGLIQANLYNDEDVAYLMEQLSGPDVPEPIEYGACLGLGLIGLGTKDTALHTSLRNVLFCDNALSGEAAALARGMVSMGALDETVVTELLEAAAETDHERVIKGAALGVALCCFNRQARAEHVIARMLADQNEYVRYAAPFAIGMAYCGSGNSSAVRRLLHSGVADVSHDVRRAAVMSLGFVLAGLTSKVTAAVTLLCDSFQPHIRYGAAMALGIGCASTADPTAVKLLRTLARDNAEFVRQAANIGLGLVLVGAPRDALPDNEVQTVRDHITAVAGSKHENTITRFGAFVAAGLIDAGGRNCRIGFRSSTGSLSPPAAAGMLLFAQTWYWFPLCLSVSLAFWPLAVVKLNAKENCKYKEMFVTERAGGKGYHPPPKPNDDAANKPAAAAVLSTTAKQRHREQMRKLRRGGQH